MRIIKIINNKKKHKTFSDHIREKKKKYKVELFHFFSHLIKKNRSIKHTIVRKVNKLT